MFDKNFSDYDQSLSDETASPQPWDGVEIPNGYSLSYQGLFKLGDDSQRNLRMAGPIWVSAFTRDSLKTAWGVIIEWINRDGEAQKRAFPMARLHEQGSGLAQELASEGLEIVPSQEKKLISYLGAFNSKARLESVSKTGWLEKDYPIYVLPLQSISHSSQKITVVFQPERYSPSQHTIRTQGSLDTWRQQVASSCRGHPFLVFSICSAFVGPLLKWANFDSFGIHLFGRSSHGKTTAAQVAASVWGCGVDPAEDAENSYIRRWNTTSNALEGLACAHNDGLLVLDELGTCSAKDFGKVIYDLSGGQGKSAFDTNRNLKPNRSWRIFFLSTGEISIEDRIKADGGAAKAGQLVRCLDIPVEGGVLEVKHSQSPQDFISQLKKNCRLYFGAAGPNFLNVLLARYPTPNELRSAIQEKMKGAQNSFSSNDLSLSPENQRALSRFFLIEAVGVLACELEILPYEKSEIQQACSTVREKWLLSHLNLSDQKRAIFQIKEFILSHQGRFEDTTESITRGINLLGYYEKNKGLFLFTEKGLKEASQGCGFYDLLKELTDQDLMLKSEKDRYKTKHWIRGKQIGLYAVKDSILEWEAHQPVGTNGTAEQLFEINQEEEIPF